MVNTVERHVTGAHKEYSGLDWVSLNMSFITGRRGNGQDNGLGYDLNWRI